MAFLLVRRRWIIIPGLLLCLGSALFAGACGLVYMLRWTYVRPVYFAAQNGQDPYQLARSGAQSLAGDFMMLAVLFAVVVFLFGFVVTYLAVRRPR